MAWDLIFLYVGIALGIIGIFFGILSSIRCGGKFKIIVIFLILSAIILIVSGILKILPNIEKINFLDNLLYFFIMLLIFLILITIKHMITCIDDFQKKK